MKSVRVRIEGRVQGVGYRAWVERMASSAGISGWVRNRADGSVEAVFQGGDIRVSEMIARCETGPSAASVTNVEVFDEAGGAFTGFEIRPTS